MNIPTYFFIVLGGFALIWGFRWAKYKEKPRPTIGEFEYAAFSAIWGSIFLLISILITNLVGIPLVGKIDEYYQVPFIPMPFLVLFEGILGAFVGKLARWFEK
jgi:hypothetical protein